MYGFKAISIYKTLVYLSFPARKSLLIVFLKADNILIYILQDTASRLLVYYSLWGPINGTGLGNWFCTKYLRLQLLLHFLLYGNYMSSHYSTLSTCCIKATVCSIRYFNRQRVGLLFDPINWQMMLQDTHNF